MKVIMLEEQIVGDVVHALDWAISKSDRDHDELQRDRFKILKSFLLSQKEKATEITSASDLARRGGQAISNEKSQAARDNGKKGGGVGNYYAFAKAAEVDVSNRRSARYVVFNDKSKRDRWVNQGKPRERFPLPATDTDLRWTQRNAPESLLDGDQIIDSLDWREDDLDQFEKYQDLP